MSASDAEPRLTFLGHSTVVIELDGVRILTDPLLRYRVVHLRRFGPRPNRASLGHIDAVLLSHLHLDHCDLPSLRRLGVDVRLIAPNGAGALLRRRGFHLVEELRPGESTRVDTVTVTATYAAHSGFRPPVGPSAVALGFLISGSQRIYFAGDTDLFPEMADLGDDLDVALLPVWGWARSLGKGHLDPRRAAEALRLLRPSIAIPIHWGTLAAPTLGPNPTRFLTEPPHLFAEHAAQLAPDVTVRIVPTGESVTLSRDAS